MLHVFDVLVLVLVLLDYYDDGFSNNERIQLAFIAGIIRASFPESIFFCTLKSLPTAH